MIEFVDAVVCVVGTSSKLGLQRTRQPPHLHASMSLCQSKMAVRRANVVDNFDKNPIVSQ